MNKLLFFVSILILLVNNIQIKTLSYYIPGAYILTPSDYGYLDEITVEIWGARGGGQYGASAYEKMRIKTEQKSFSINVGKGGIDGENGESSSIISMGEYPRYGIIIEGGQGEGSGKGQGEGSGKGCDGIILVCVYGSKSKSGVVIFKNKIDEKMVKDKKIIINNYGTINMH